MNRGILSSLAQPSDSKILLLVLDGLGGLPHPKTGRTELESAESPNLDRWAAEGATGLHDPIARGITPGSGPAHLGLFGYDPVADNVGRGVLSALGAELSLTARDVAARINFATRGPDGNIADRRAGRISSEDGERVAALLAGGIRIPGVEVTVCAEKEHRAVVVFRGEGLSGDVADTDPQCTGVPARDPAPTADDPCAARTAAVAGEFVTRAREILAGEPAANDVLLRGFAGWDPPRSFHERYGLRGIAIAQYPMYRGLARLVGMGVAPTPASIEEGFDLLPDALGNSDFVYLHIKQTDSAGEDADFDRKVSVIEEVDALLPKVEAAAPDIMIVTGDHSTPALMGSHSSHPVPILLRGGHAFVDETRAFGETACRTGSLGRFPAREIMAEALAAAGRLQKFGA